MNIMNKLFLLFFLLKNIFFLNIIFNDAPIPWQFGFQDSASPNLTEIEELHDTIIFYLIVIAMVVLWILVSLYEHYTVHKNLLIHKYITHGTFIELFWTITPVFVLLLIGNASFKLLYLLDEVISPSITLKVIGLFKKCGLNSYIKNKIKNTLIRCKNLIQQLNIELNIINLFLYKGNLIIILLSLIYYLSNNYSKLYKFHNSNLNYSKKINFNIQKRNFNSNCRAIKRIGPHNKDVISVIFGLLLGERKIYINSYSQSPDLIKSFSNTENYKESININLDPNWITGFTDAEGSFIISIFRSETHKLKWRIFPVFSIQLSNKDIKLLENINTFFGVGRIVQRKTTTTVIYSVTSINDIKNVIIPHFLKYPLLSQKRADFELFKEVLELIFVGKHLTVEGLNTILSIKASMNKGLSEELKVNFPNIISVKRPNINLPIAINPYWISGFVNGEGCFFCNIINGTTKTGKSVSLLFEVVQHKRDKALLSKFIEIFKGGKVYIKPLNYVKYDITKFNEIYSYVIPFFNKYPLQGIKADNFKDFMKIANLMQKKLHLTKSGLQEITTIKNGMNTKRLVNNVKIKDAKKDLKYITEGRKFGE
jgi:hypothetical protein